MKWLRRAIWLAGLLFLFALVATLLVWYHTRNLEEKVFALIQPHLNTDVRVRALEMTLWSRWPNAELVFYDVAIEDAIERDEPFAEFAEVGVEFGWLPLLQGELQVERVHLVGGRLHLQHERGGESNWSFWKEGDGEDPFALSIRRMVMTEVAFSGKWWTEAEAEPLVWSANVRELDLDATWEEGRLLTLDGATDALGVKLKANGTDWLDGVDLTSGVSVDLVEDADGRWSASLVNGTCVLPEGNVPFSAVMGASPDFGLALRLGRSDVQQLLGLVPDFLLADLSGEYRFGGRVDVDVIAGQPPVNSLWTGPKDVGWTGEWAVKVGVHSGRLVAEGMQVEQLNGEVSAYDIASGVESHWRGLSGKTLGGEFSSTGHWTRKGGDESIEVGGEGVFRPGPLYERLAGAESLPEGWTIEEKGVFRASGEATLNRKALQDWAWDSGEVQCALSDVGIDVGSGVLVLDQWDGVLSAAKLDCSFSGLEAPGVSGQGNGRFNLVERTADLSFSCGFVNLDTVFSWQPEGDVDVLGSTGGGWHGVTWSCAVEQLKLGELDARNLRVSGAMDPSRKMGEVKGIEADIFGGRVNGTASWNRDGVTFMGLLADADMPELLAQTEGLGQSTLRPQHARGRVWADGMLRYRFGRSPEFMWETDLQVRIEGAELVDFELLQRIPETLRDEARFKILADADDLSRRLRWVRFDPMEFHVFLDQGVITLDPVEVASDAMDLGIVGWQSLAGGMDYTLDFAVRDLKSNQDEFGTTADDGLGHRFFLSITGSMDDPQFGYDKDAHREHRRDSRQAALERLRGVIGLQERQSSDSILTMTVDSSTVSKASLRNGKEEKQASGLDDDDDF